MSDSPRDDLTELTRALVAHVAWQRELGVLELSHTGSLPAPRIEVAAPVEPPAATPVAKPSQPVAAQPVAAVPPTPVAPPAITYAAAPVATPAPAAKPPTPVVRPLFADAAAPSDGARVKGPLLEGEARVAALRVIQDEVVGCTSCRLAQKRTQTVFSRGNPFARLCFIGEGPGEMEDRSGLPFVGPAGQLLDKIIAAMGLSPDEVYICNVVKCRPPNNRTPEPDEMRACSPFLVRQLDLVRPEVIVALGRTAVGFLLDSKDSMSRMRGKWHSYEGIPVLPTWHPAYLLRTPEAKGDTWADMKLVMARLGLTPPPRG
jgi:uracil-DNA glycosylase